MSNKTVDAVYDLFFDNVSSVGANCHDLGDF